MTDARTDKVKLFIEDPVKAGKFMPADPQTILATAADISTHYFSSREIFKGMETVKDRLPALLQGADAETFWIGYLDADKRLIAFEKAFDGTIDNVPAYVREITKKALSHNAYAVFVVHNHVDGKSEPSDADINVTQKLGRALQLVDVVFTDHYVVGTDGVTSIKDYIKTKVVDKMKGAGLPGSLGRMLMAALAGNGSMEAGVIQLDLSGDDDEENTGTPHSEILN